jgi:4-carboxymuconolactone decarboxylase
MPSHQSAFTNDDVLAVSPALAKFTEETVAGELWNRQQLSARDRAVVTVSALIARSQTVGMLNYFNKALDCGVTAAELSEIVTHLAFYSGWSNAFSAVPSLTLSSQRLRHTRKPPSLSVGRPTGR